jgi:hypothetical protein
MTDFADRVRILASEETERLGLAGREGQVYGWTTPSMTGVSVIGSAADDQAVNVYFDELEEDFWFAETLIEMVGHGAGTVAGIEGSDFEFVRLENGEWEKRPRSG